VAGGYTGLDMGLTSPVALNGSEDIRTQSAIAPMESTPKKNPRSENAMTHAEMTSDKKPGPDRWRRILQRSSSVPIASSRSIPTAADAKSA
jgi:hypothetical protein